MLTPRYTIVSIGRSTHYIRTEKISELMEWISRNRYISAETQCLLRADISIRDNRIIKFRNGAAIDASQAHEYPIKYVI